MIEGIKCSRLETHHFSDIGGEMRCIWCGKTVQEICEEDREMLNKKVKEQAVEKEQKRYNLAKSFIDYCYYDETHKEKFDIRKYHKLIEKEYKRLEG